MAIIKTKCGTEVLVDDELVPFLSRWTWRLSDTGYVVTTWANCVMRMHRVVTAAPQSAHVDHKNRNRLDNRWDNLRLTNARGNACNRGPNRRRGGVQYKGVYYNAGRYEARIKIHNRPHYLGRFATPEEAAEVYNKAAKELHGEFAYQNVVAGSRGIEPLSERS